MQLKWLGRILYIIIIVFLTQYVLLIGYVSRGNEYFTQEIRDQVNDNIPYLEGIATLQNLDYFKEDPIYTFSANEDDAQFDVNIYATGFTYNEVNYDGFMLLINNIHIFEDGNEIENPVLRIIIDLSDETFSSNDGLVSQAIQTYDPTVEGVYQGMPLVLLYEENGYLLNDNGTEDTADDIIASVNKITVNYSNRELDENDQFIFNPDGMPLFVASNGSTDNAIASDSTFTLDRSSYELSDQFAGDFPTDQEIIDFNLNTNAGDMSGYNWEIWRTMLIYVLAIVVITYFLFFHKHVRARLNQRRENTSSNVIDAKVEPIFKDEPVDESKDGK